MKTTAANTEPRTAATPIADYAAAVVATWPPLTPAQVARLTALFGGEA